MISIFLLIINLITFGAFGFDKYFAKSNKWRIPEKTLFLLTFFGGSGGAVLGMFLFKHKISKPSFYTIIIAIIVIQIGFIYFFGQKGMSQLCDQKSFKTYRIIL